MKNAERSTARSAAGMRAARGFSLIELLVVMGVIAALAALTFPIMGAIKRAQTLHRARAELAQIEMAIEAYKTKLGFYPPDNPGYWTTNQLYFELLGTTLVTNAGQPTFQTLDGSAQVRNTPAAFKTAFGPNTKITRFMNCARAGAGDDAPSAVKFLIGLKPAQFLAINSPVTTTVLGTSMAGVPVFTGPGSTTGEITPYGYNSSNPQHNPKSFDLWIDVLAGGKTNRVSNWSEKPTIVYWTSPANAYP